MSSNAQQARPAPPRIDGLNWRPIGERQADQVAPLAAACVAVDGGLPVATEVEFLKKRYLSAEEGRSIGAYAREQMVALASLRLAERESERRALLFGLVHPVWRGQGIGRFLLDWGEWAAAKVLMRTDDGRERFLAIATESLTDRADAFYRRRGYQPEFGETVMRFDLAHLLPEYELAAGLTVEPWSGANADDFFAAYEACFRERPGFPGWSQQEWQAWAAGEDTFRPERSFVVRGGELPVAFVVCDDAWVVQMGVAPEWRGCGLGAALLTRVLHLAKAAGDAEVMLDVAFNNPHAAALYARVGFTMIGRRARYMRRMDDSFS